ncbi:MAG: hypothetical protein EAZ11_06660 [Curvibacter sp.]|nr:MAG: hypothetical protein EAZ11_06660 [Curvibacter sp.]
MNKVSSLGRLASVSGVAFAGAAHAAVPAAVTTAIGEAQADLTTAIGAVIAAMVVVWGLRKLGQKMGWL